MSNKPLGVVAAILLVFLAFAFAFRAEAVTIDLVPVGNPGNPGELSGEGAGGWGGPDAIVGSVDYEYSIGKYEVTTGQYCEFLNAVAKTDTYMLYHPFMSSSPTGCKIERSGSPGDYVYTVASDRVNRPVNCVSWNSAARFCNWLHNGQPVGMQDISTTEDGAYYLNGATDYAVLLTVTREPDARWAIPTEDEWYKAAYHKNDGATGNYWDYPTSSDTKPSYELIDPDPGNNANFWYEDTIGAPYYMTEVGAFEQSASPYGTFDQGGNVSEWNEDVMHDVHRATRGGAFSSSDLLMLASSRPMREWPSFVQDDVGFRVVSIPEPGCVCLLIGGLAVGLGSRRRR